MVALQTAFDWDTDEDWRDVKVELAKEAARHFGPSGMFEQDDVENWVSITDMAGGSMARRLRRGTL